MVVGSSRSSSSSSGEEDGDAVRKAAIDSVATTSDPFLANCFSATTNNTTTTTTKTKLENDHDHDHKPKLPKHYLVKAQKLLKDIVENNLEIVRQPIDVVDDESAEELNGIRLFRNAPPGIIFDHIDEPQGPKKRPRILRGSEFDERSKEFRKRIQSVAVDGKHIMAAAEASRNKSLTRLEAKERAAKEAAKREEDRVAELKRIRGEKWLPSIAKEMQLKH